MSQKQPRPHHNKQLIATVLFKGVVGAVGFLLFFGWNIQKVGQLISDQSDPIVQPIEQGSGDSLRYQELQQEFENLLDPQHSVGDNLSVQSLSQKTARLCTNYRTLCNKIHIDQTLSDQRKYAYLVMSTFVISQLDRMLTTSSNFTSTLRTLTINGHTYKRRGQAGHFTIIINLGSIRTNKEFVEILVHELGHILDLGIIRDNYGPLDPYFTEFGNQSFGIGDPSLLYYQISWLSEDIRQGSSQAEDFVSGYAMTNPFEDFAEAHNAYHLHNRRFRTISQSNSSLQQKYNQIAGLYGQQFLFGGSLPTQTQRNSNRRPRDTTRMNQ